MYKSILHSSIRSFLNAFFAIIGICFGMVLAFFLIAGLSSSTSQISSLIPAAIYTPELVANADGIRKELSIDTPIILKLNISGIIGTDKLNMNSFRTQLIESREGIFDKNRVKALLLHIESPGGTVVDADGIYREILSYKKQYQVPVYAYVDGLCASGGMYIAAAADKIYASDISLIGSIGVISPPIFNFSKTMEKLGVESLTFFAGKGKDDLNSFRAWQTNEGNDFQKIINCYYNRFVEVMTTNRKNLDASKLIEEHGANVFSASDAKTHGFIDEAGLTLNDTINELKRKIGVTDNQYLVVQLDKKNWISEIFGSKFLLLNGKIRHEFNVLSPLPQELMHQFLYLYSP